VWLPDSARVRWCEEEGGKRTKAAHEEEPYAALPNVAPAKTKVAQRAEDARPGELRQRVQPLPRAGRLGGDASLPCSSQTREHGARPAGGGRLAAGRLKPAGGRGRGGGQAQRRGPAGRNCYSCYSCYPANAAQQRHATQRSFTQHARHRPRSQRAAPECLHLHHSPAHSSHSRSLTLTLRLTTTLHATTGSQRRFKWYLRPTSDDVS